MKDYIIRAPRTIQGNVINGFIKRDNEEKANEAFAMFCQELVHGRKMQLACKRTKKKMKISLTVSECPAKSFSQEKSTYEVHVG